MRLSRVAKRLSKPRTVSGIMAGTCGRPLTICQGRPIWKNRPRLRKPVTSQRTRSVPCPGFIMQRRIQPHRAQREAGVLFVTEFRCELCGRPK